MKRKGDVTSMGGSDLRFPPTQWSQVLSARAAETGQRTVAMEALVQRYWKPVYAFIRFEWSKDNEKAKDLTQAFLLSLIEREALDGVGPEKGRFRDFLKASLRNFLRKDHRDARRLKRGGGAARVPFEEAEAVADPARSAEEAFDRTWRSEVLKRALDELRLVLTARGKGVYWEVLHSLVLADGAPPTYAEVASRLGLTVSEVTNHLHAARKKLREVLKCVLMEGLSDPNDLDDEWRSVVGRSVDR